MKDDSGVTFSQTGFLHITAGLDFLEGSKKKREREIMRLTRKKSQRRAAALVHKREKRGEKKSVSDHVSTHQTQLSFFFFCFVFIADILNFCPYSPLWYFGP